VHIKVDLAGASSLLRIEPGMISTLSALSVAPPQLRGKFEKQLFTVSLLLANNHV